MFCDKFVIRVAFHVCQFISIAIQEFIFFYGVIYKNSKPYTYSFSCSCIEITSGTLLLLSLLKIAHIIIVKPKKSLKLINFKSNALLYITIGLTLNILLRDLKS